MPTIVDGVLSKERQAVPVFTYLCSEIGETRDVYRFDIAQNDLDTAADLYNVFKAAGVRSEHREAKRCKIVSIDEFYNGSHWSVERWWTREEKIALGIEDEIDSVGVDDFASLVGDISNTLLEYQDAIRSIPKKKADLSYKTISITDAQYFELITNAIGLNRTLLDQIDTHDKNDIPVYTGGKVPVVNINALDKKATIQATEEQPVLSFASNGENAGSNFVLHTRPFYINTDRIAVIMKGKINIQYIFSQIFNMKRDYGFNWSHKANRHNLTKVTIDISIEANGDFDLASQQIIAEQFALVNELKNEIKEKYQKISTISIAPDIVADIVKNVKVADAFNIIRGNGKYTKSYTQSHDGNYPLFSGNTAREFATIDSFDFDTPCLSWAIDGLAGYVMSHKMPFSATNHRGVLLPKSTDIDVDYARYILEPKFREMKKGRFGDNGQNEYTSLPPFMITDIEFEISVDKEGRYDIIAQREIADKYIAIDQYKAQILEKLGALISQRIDY